MIEVPPIVAAKLALYTAMRKQGITNVALAARLGVTENAVRRLVNPRHRSHITSVEKALRAVGRSLVVEDKVAV
jgi:antitoxin HicB